MDIVWMQGVESCVLFAQKMGAAKSNTYLIPFIKKFGEEKSWRLWYLVAENIVRLAESFGEEIT